MLLKNLLVHDAVHETPYMADILIDGGKIVSLGEISMFTTGEDVTLSEVLTNTGKKEGLKPVGFDPKKADNETLKSWFGQVLPDWDEDRVYPSDIRKLIQWYNILVNAGITDFTIEEAATEE